MKIKFKYLGTRFDPVNNKILHYANNGNEVVLIGITVIGVWQS